ncbi:MAG: PTS sugar transporter subunit IIA [Clostridium sp.]|nr:PTS sugar transporter subunit IIA [Clostridium sp.]
MLPILKKECMLFQMEAADKMEAIRKMAEAFNREGYLTNYELFKMDVLDREEVFSTYIGYGIGLPHGKSNGVKHAGLCIARLNQPVVWSEDSGSKVNLIIMIAVNNERADDLHLQILSKLSRLLMHEDFRTELLSGSREEVYEVLADRLEV